MSSDARDRVAICDRPAALCVRPDAQRLGDRRAGARPVCRTARRRCGVRPADRALAAVGCMDIVEPCARPADGPRMAGGAARTLPRAAKEYPELAGLHDLRTRTSGTHHFAQFHVWVPADWTVQEAHDRLDRGRGGAAAALSRHRNPDPCRSRRPDRPGDPAAVRTSRSKRR